MVEETGPRASRNRLQTVTLLDAIADGFDAAFGGARRDEERARAKERAYPFRDDFGQWEPKRQRPEVWALYNGRIRKGEHVRVFPLSNWTELDVWQYIDQEKLEVPSNRLRPHPTGVRARRHVVRAQPARAVDRGRNTVRDLGPVPDGRRDDCTGAVRSLATTLPEVVSEIAATRITERGETRADDRVTEAAMEDRKREAF